jgi:hypothetical protein
MKLIDHVINRFNERYRENNTPWTQNSIPDGVIEFARRLKEYKTGKLIS